MPPHRPPNRDPRRILLIRPSALGDVCRTVPLAVSLKRRWPDAEIHWLVQDAFTDAVRAHPDVARVIPFQRRRVAVRRWHTRDARQGLRELFAHLRAPRYDLVIDAQGLIRSAIFALATRAPTRVGYANAHELGWLALNHRVDTPIERHTVDRMLDLAAAVDAPPVHDLRLHAPAESQPQTDELLRDLPPFIAVAPTSRWPGKRWPDDRFARLIQRLRADAPDRAVVILGGRGEEHQCPATLDLANRDPLVRPLLARTSVATLMGVIQRADLLIANDSAALHIAVGFDRPLLGLFGPTRIHRVGPYRRDHDVIQPAPPPPSVSHKDDDAGRALMDRITVDHVHHAALQRLNHARTPA